MKSHGKSSHRKQKSFENIQLINQPNIFREALSINLDQEERKTETNIQRRIRNRDKHQDEIT